MKQVFLLCLFALMFGSAIAREPSQPIGFYSNGRLARGYELPKKGTGYVLLFPARDRAWGAHTLVDAITKAGKRMNKLFPKRERIQVGDLSAMKGGPISRHGSHENGLDVDVAYFRTDKVEQKPNKVDGFATNMVRKNKVSKNFDVKMNWELIKSFHASAKVQRIFMHPLIKRELCLHAKANKELKKNVKVLKSIRPLDNHADHMHVRLYCPPKTKSCKSQDEVPDEVGC